MTPAARVARVLTTVVATVIGATTSGLGVAVARDVTAAPVVADVQPLTILQQTFELAAQDTFVVDVRLPDGIDATTIGEDGSTVVLQVVAFGALTDRKDVARIRNGSGSDALRQVEDTFEIPLGVADADPHVARPAVDRLSISVGVEAVSSDVGLQLPREGVYPIELELRIDGDPVGDIVTFVHRRSAGESTIGDLPIAILMAQTSTPAVETDGTVSLSEAEHDDLQELTESLEAMDAVATADDPTAATLPRAALVQPATMQVLQEEDPELAARLAAVLGRSEVLAAPQLPIDPSSVVAAGRQQVYTDWLRAGEDLVGALVPGTRTDRSLYLANTPISDGAVSYLAGTGVDALVMAPDLYDDTAGSIQDYGDPTWLQTIRLADGGTVPVLRIDPYIGARLTASPTDPTAAAVDLMAEVLTYRQFLGDQGRLVPRTGLLLASTDARAIEPKFAAEIARRLLQIDGLHLVTPGDLISTMDDQLVDGSLGTLTLPTDVGVDLSERFRTIDEINLEASGVVTMLPNGDGHVAQWNSLISTMPSSALSDAQVDEMVATLRRGFDQFRNGIEGPTPFPFTLTGRTGTIRFRLHNTTDTPLNVIVRLEGAKLTFEQNDLPYTIGPGGQTMVEAVAESKSNGTSQVIVRILTPSGAQILPDIALTAQVRAFTGLGQLLTGALLLVVATWWVRHWRLVRRRKGATATSDRHPAVLGRRRRARVAGPAADPAADPADEAAPADDSLAPDAAASSLPPS